MMLKAKMGGKNGNGNQQLCKARRHTFRPLLWSVCPGSLTASSIANCWMCLSAPFKKAGWKCLIWSVTTQFSNDLSIFHLSEYYLSIHAGLTTFCSFWHITVDTLGWSVWVSTFAEVFVLPCRPPLTLSPLRLSFIFQACDTGSVCVPVSVFYPRERWRMNYLHSISCLSLHFPSCCKGLN